MASQQHSEQLTMLKESVRQFCDERIAPIAEQIDRDNQFPQDLWPQIGALGLFGATIEEGFGGVNMGYLAHAIIMEEISRASGAIGLSYAAHSNLCMNQIQRYGTEAQKQAFLPKLATGEFLGALAMSEVGSGSDVVSMQCVAQATEDGFILNGHKMWITNGPLADVCIVYAKTDKEKGKRGISAFLVEKGAPGFSSAQKLDKLGMRGSDTSELIFKDVHLPKDALFGPLNEGVKVLMSGLDYERLILAAGPVGIMQACLDAVLPYVAERKQFGKAIGEFQLVQGKIADMYAVLQASRAYLYQAAEQADAGNLKREDAAALFLFVSENATKVALDAIQLFGGNGYTNEYPLGRYLRDAKLYEIGGGTSEIRRMLIGRELIKAYQ